MRRVGSLWIEVREGGGGLKEGKKIAQKGMQTVEARMRLSLLPKVKGD